MKLASFVQVSDLHFGEIDFKTSGDARTSRIWSYASVAYKGLMGHEFASMQALERFMAERETDALLVTGDLTRVGHPNDFDFGSSFLGDLVALPKNRRIGLQRPDWADTGIPGNHDHWPGVASIVGPPTEGLKRAFRPTPFTDATCNLGSGHVVRFIGIDTDADISPLGQARVLARGAFRSQLKKTAGELPKPMDGKEIRVLLLHHSVSHRGRVLGIERASRQALADFVNEHGISVLLSGHLHVPRISAQTLTHTKQASVLEARCGTTTVRSELPYDWHRFGIRPKGRPVPNSLITHELRQEGPSIVWDAQVFLKLPTGFHHHSKSSVEIPFADKIHQVWPLAPGQPTP